MVRFSLNKDDTQLFPPDVCLTLSHPEGIISDNYGGNNDIFRAAILSKKDLIFAISGEPPRHYTWLHLHKESSLPPVWAITYKDALPDPSAPNIQRAKQLLVNLGLPEEAAKIQGAANKDFQVDGWSCGIWDIKWAERLLRRLRGGLRE